MFGSYLGKCKLPQIIYLVPIPRNLLIMKTFGYVIVKSTNR